MTIDPVASFLLAVAVILIVCHACGELMRRLRQPTVLGEILGGLVLGPSVLGLVWPGADRVLFPTHVLDGLNRAAQLGLIMFMFVLGCELRTDRVARPRAVAAVVLGGMGLPFVVGIGIALAARSSFSDPTGPPVAYVLFFGLAIAITALPVLARILLDLRLDHTGVGVLSLSSAAVGDGVAWLVLAVILAGTTAGAGGPDAFTAALAVAVVLGTFLLIRRALAALIARMTSEHLLTVILVAGAVAYSALTQMVHLHPVIGAFLFGAAVPRESAVIDLISRRLRGFTLTILLPLFFAGVGLTTSIALLGRNPAHWLLFAAVLVAAQVTKLVGAGGAARLAGLSRRQALEIGVLMNCRGVTELVVATVGLHYGLINRMAFTVLVLMAVLTTAVTGPVMRYLIRAEPAVRSWRAIQGTQVHRSGV